MVTMTIFDVICLAAVSAAFGALIPLIVESVEAESDNGDSSICHRRSGGVYRGAGGSRDSCKADGKVYGGPGEMSMDYRAFENAVRKTVADYTNKAAMADVMSPDEVYIVWSCKTLQNWKALAATPLPDGRYFEITYNGNKNELYLDAYQKEANEVTKF